MFKNKGFTLIEVLLVIIIVGILAAIVIPRITYTAKTAKQEACNSNAAALNSQIELYNVREGDWPASLAALVTADYIDVSPTCPFGTASPYVYSTTTHRVAKHSHP